MYVMHSLLRGVVQHGTASRLRRYGLGYVAIKTRTTGDYRDAWFVGYAGIVSAVWVGFDHGAPLRLSSARPPSDLEPMSAFPHLRRPQTAGRRAFPDIDRDRHAVAMTAAPDRCMKSFSPAPGRRSPASGFFGNIARRLFFERDHFGSRAITDQFRKWAGEVDHEREYRGAFRR